MSGLISRRSLLTGRAARSAAPAIAGNFQGIAEIGGACISVRGVTCRLCSDPCEPDAIGFRPLGGGRVLPEITAMACTGCGACVSACPAGAIVLAPRPGA